MGRKEMVDKFDIDKHVGYSGPNGPYYKVHFVRSNNRDAFIVTKEKVDFTAARCLTFTGYWEQDSHEESIQIFVPYENIAYIENLIYKSR